MKIIFTLQVPLHVFLRFRLQITLTSFFFFLYTLKRENLHLVNHSLKVIIHEPDFTHLQHAATSYCIWTSEENKTKQANGFWWSIQLFCLFMYLFCFWFLIIHQLWWIFSIPWTPLRLETSRVHIIKCIDFVKLLVILKSIVILFKTVFFKIYFHIYWMVLLLHLHISKSVPVSSTGICT